MCPMSPRLLRPRQAGGFDPRTMTGLQLWFDFADRSTVLNSISPDTPATDGQAVRRWLDKSGFARHANQTTGANQPIAGATGMTFDGSNDELDIAGAVGVARNISYVAMFAAYSWLTNPTSNKLIFSATNSNTVQTRVGISGGAVSGRFATGGRRLDADALQSVSSSASISTSVRVVHSGILTYSSALAENRINGAIDGSSSSFQTSGNTSDTDSVGVRIAGIAGSSAFAPNISLCELLVYTPSTPLTAQQVSTIERYLGRKWGVTVA